MKFEDIYSYHEVTDKVFFSQKQPVISFEVFPIKGEYTIQKNEPLLAELEVLSKFNPAVISITYGAGGSNKDNSLALVNAINENFKALAMPHFTCVGETKEKIEAYLHQIEALGIKNILALRGDMPKDSAPCFQDFEYANELVEFIKEKTNLSIAVAGYPEGHNCDESLEINIDYLKMKVDAGADAVYTQLFFENTYFFSFMQLVRDAGINVPIIPGILPITSYSQLERMASLCKVTIPKSLLEQLEKYKNNLDDVKKVGIEFATYQCQQLIDSGVKGLHMYCLNKAEPVCTILENIL